MVYTAFTNLPFGRSSTPSVRWTPPLNRRRKLGRHMSVADTDVCDPLYKPPNVQRDCSDNGRLRSVLARMPNSFHPYGPAGSASARGFSLSGADRRLNAGLYDSSSTAPFSKKNDCP